MYSDKIETILDRREMLRVKVKSLAVEAAIIRREEQRNYGVLRNELRIHRTLPLRYAARHAHIAYGLVRGLTLKQMEPVSYKKLDWNSIGKMLKAYGPRNHIEILEKAKASELVTERVNKGGNQYFASSVAEHIGA